MIALQIIQEQEGAKRMFGRSEENRGLKYTHFYGDGDSKSFKVVENIYPDKKVIKYECIAHYQKRVGNRLRKLKRNTPGLGGTGNLPNVTIDMLQNYFGIALRR